MQVAACGPAQLLAGAAGEAAHTAALVPHPSHLALNPLVHHAHQPQAQALQLRTLRPQLLRLIAAQHAAWCAVWRSATEAHVTCA
jgi:hypothetical protein